jgi:hypothetical protein
MKLKSWKNLALSLGFASTFTLCAGLSNSANVSAQDWRNNCSNISRQEWERREEILRNRGWNGRVDNNGNVDLNRNGIDDRCEDDLFLSDRYDYDRYGNRTYRAYPNNRGYYGNSRYSNEEQLGYRDGLERGREDAFNNRRADPNNSSHYRNGSTAYREGFRRGFFQAYRQYSDYPEQ